MIDTCHGFDVEVSTGGFVEHVLVADHDHAEDYITEAAALGFDIVAVSSGFLAIDTADLVALTELVGEHSLKANPEVNVQFGAGGASTVEELESEGITERVREWRTDVAFAIADGLGVENCVFEAADPQVFEWYVKNFGLEVNLFVDNTQVVELECICSGLWDKKSSRGRVASFKRERDRDDRAGRSVDVDVRRAFDTVEGDFENAVVVRRSRGVLVDPGRQGNVFLVIAILRAGGDGEALAVALEVDTVLFDAR